jgi:biotin transport system substrate-specific component
MIEVFDRFKERVFFKGLEVFFTSLMGSFFIALFANVKIFLPFTPVPIVLQMQMVFLLVFLLGRKKAVLSVIFFLIQGGMGLPVFSGGYGLFGVTSGYLFGYLVAAFLIGEMVKNGGSYLRYFVAICVGTFVVYILGFFVLSFYLGVEKAFILGVLPFIPGGILKNLFLIKLLKVLKK